MANNQITTIISAGSKENEEINKCLSDIWRNYKFTPSIVEVCNISYAFFKLDRAEYNHKVIVINRRMRKKRKKKY